MSWLKSLEIGKQPSFLYVPDTSYCKTYLFSLLYVISFAIFSPAHVGEDPIASSIENQKFAGFNLIAQLCVGQLPNVPASAIGAAHSVTIVENGNYAISAAIVAVFTDWVAFVCF
jgi:hypothetical protein